MGKPYKTATAGKTQKGQRRSGVNEISQGQSGDSAFQFAGNRPEAIAQRQLQEIANGSPHVRQMKAFQEIASHGSQAKKAAQFQAMADHSVTPQQAIQNAENSTGLSDDLKSGIENLSGYSMDDVKVHYNSSKPAQLQAHAYAQGTDIHLGPGQEKHLPHEAWHVVQQKQGRVKATLQLQDKVNINDDVGLENEADVMGTKAVQRKASVNCSTGKAVVARSQPLVQRVSVLGKETTTDVADDDFRVLEKMNGFQLGKLRGKIKHETNELLSQSGTEQLVSNNKRWEAMIDKWLMPEVERLTKSSKIDSKDGEAFKDLSALKSQEGATKRVYLSEESKKVMATSKTLEPQEMLDEMLKLEYLGQQGIATPQTYLGGFAEYDKASGFPVMNVAAKDKEPVKKITFAMDRLPESNWYDLWKEVGKFASIFIKNKPGMASGVKINIISGLGQILGFLASHVVVDLQIAITAEGRVYMVDPVRVYQLGDKDDMLFLDKNKNILSLWHTGKELIAGAIMNLKGAEEKPGAWCSKIEIGKIENLSAGKQPQAFQDLYASVNKGKLVTLELIKEAIKAYGGDDTDDLINIADDEFIEAMKGIKLSD
jgi:hypothetical protein